MRVGAVDNQTGRAELLLIVGQLGPDLGESEEIVFFLHSEKLYFEIFLALWTLKRVFQVQMRGHLDVNLNSEI